MSTIHWNWISARKYFLQCSFLMAGFSVFVCGGRLISLSLSEAHWSELRSAEHTFSEAHGRGVSLWRTQDLEHLDDCCDGRGISKTREERRKWISEAAWQQAQGEWAFSGTRSALRKLLSVSSEERREKREKREGSLCALNYLMQ